MRILWVKVGGIWPPNSGGRLRSYHLIKELAREHDLCVLTTHSPDDLRDGGREPPDLAAEVLSFPHAAPKRRDFRFARALLRSWFSREPVDMLRCYSPALRAEVEKRLRSGRYDLCVADFLFSVPNVDFDAGVPVLLFAHNVEHMIWKRVAGTTRSPIRRLALEIEWRKSRRYEAMACRRANHVVAVSDADRALLSEMAPSASVDVVPTGVDVDFYAPTSSAESPAELVYVGSMDWYPNEDGVTWFISEALPLVRKQFPAVRMTIVGRNPTRELRRLATTSGIRVTGTVDDVRRFLDKASLCIVPLRIGGGTRLKIFEALAMGKATVSTSIGAEGLPVSPGRDIVIADGASDFADAVIDLLQNPDRRRALGIAGRRLVVGHHSWSQVARNFDKYCRLALPPVRELSAEAGESISEVKLELNDGTDPGNMVGKNTDRSERKGEEDGMRIAVFGLGYVGCVTAARLAEAGHDVTGVDVSDEKVEMVNSGRSPIIEPGLGNLIARVVQSGRLRACTGAADAVGTTEVALVCVGTPGKGNGSIDTAALQRVSREIGRALNEHPHHYTVVVRSTVLPGTLEAIVVPALLSGIDGRPGVTLDVAVNPEFIREGSALDDFLAPPFTLVGSESRAPADLLRDVYVGVTAPLIHTDVRTAEMIKYACNAFHAMKVCFTNEIADVCDALGADARHVMQVFRTDRRLNVSEAYLKPGFAFGGSCLPKDLRALTYAARRADVPLPLIGSILPSNEARVRAAVETVCAAGRRRIGVAGLAFKAGTDDLRESPLVSLVEALIGKGLDVRILDRSVSVARLHGANRRYIESEIPHIASLLCASEEELLAHAQVLIIGNESEEAQRVAAAAARDTVLIDLTRSGFGAGLGQLERVSSYWAQPQVIAAG